jgi:protein-S-isoprenylcysteine O-methyltransferase Ste14
MNFLKKAWAWLNGKKTTIGGALVVLSVIIIQIFGIWHFDPTWLQPLADTLRYIGDSVFLVGGLHKVVKAFQ